MDNPLLAIPALVVLAAFLFLHLRGQKKYAQFIQAMDKDEFGLRSIMTVGFSFMEMIHYGYGNKIDRTLRKQLLELYDEDYIEFYLRVYWAAAVTYGFLAALFGTLLFAASGDTLMLALLAAAPVVGYLALSNVGNKVEERHQKVALALPDFTNQLIILSGAGLTLRSAIIKVGSESTSKDPFYDALRRAVNRMENGTTDEAALDTLVTACNMPIVRRLVSVLLQNMQRGGTDVLNAMREIGEELWTNRKAAARQAAEQVSTKILLPMVLSLLAVILLVTAPAVMSMNI